MNKTQKGAWFTFGVAVLLIVFSIIVFKGMFLSAVEARKPVGIWFLLILFFIGGSVVFLCKKQSPAEVDSDERDNLIKKRSVLACFVSIWILLIAASIIPTFIVGDGGSIPVDLLPIINFCIFLIAMLVYSVAVLVQYYTGGKKGGSEEGERL